MPILVEHDAGWAGAISPALPAGTHVVPTTADAGHRLHLDPDDYVVVIGPNVEFEDAATLAAKLRHSHPTTGMILLRHHLDAGTYEAAMAAGIPAVVNANDPHALSTAAERARETWQAIRGPMAPGGGCDGKVVAVFSPKGGVGKTTIAVNLALALSREYAAKVCIVDMDLAYGDVAITLQLIPEHTVYEAAGAEEHLDFSLLETLLTHHEDCAIMAAPTHSEGRNRIAPALVTRLLQVLRDHFDFVVVDNAPSFDPHVTQVFGEADTVLMVATLDVPTVKNVKMALETLDGLGVPRDQRLLVLNRADDAVGLTPDNVEGLLKMPIGAALPSDVAVASGTNQGTPIVALEPGHPVSRELIRLAGVLAPERADLRRADGKRTPKRATKRPGKRSGERGLRGRRAK